MLHMLSQCFLSICCGYHLRRAEVLAGITAEHGDMEQSFAPVSWELRDLLGMWCVAVEMTLTIHISNDLKQFTLQLKQDLSCDNPEEIVTC